MTIEEIQFQILSLRCKLAMEFYKLSVLASDEGSRESTIKWAAQSADLLLKELKGDQ